MGAQNIHHRNTTLPLVLFMARWRCGGSASDGGERDVLNSKLNRSALWTLLVLRSLYNELYQQRTLPVYESNYGITKQYAAMHMTMHNAMYNILTSSSTHGLDRSSEENSVAHILKYNLKYGAQGLKYSTVRSLRHKWLDGKQLVGARTEHSLKHFTAHSLDVHTVPSSVLSSSIDGETWWSAAR